MAETINLLHNLNRPTSCSKITLKYASEIAQYKTLFSHVPVCNISFAFCFCSKELRDRIKNIFLYLFNRMYFIRFV